MKKLFALLLTLALLIPAALGSTLAEVTGNTLAEGITFAEALAYAGMYAEQRDYKADYSAMVFDQDAGTVEMQFGWFFVVVHNSPSGSVDSISVEADSFSGHDASDMGYVFGALLAHFAGITDAETISPLDNESFVLDEKGTQTLIVGDYLVTLKNDPALARQYRMQLALRPAAASAGDINDALTILEAMDLQTSARFLYDADSDLNHKLGNDGEYYSKVNFALTSIAPDAQDDPDVSVEDGGSIEVFREPVEAFDRLRYVEATQLQYFGSAEIAIVSGSALLRLSPALAPEAAGEIIAAFLRSTPK